MIERADVAYSTVDVATEFDLYLSLSLSDFRQYAKCMHDTSVRCPAGKYPVGGIEEKPKPKKPKANSNLVENSLGNFIHMPST